VRDQFTMEKNAPPQVVLASPRGGERWVAGSGHDIRWSASDDRE
jgi:hypothetical protein